VTEAKAQDLAHVISAHVTGATEVWQAAYRGTDRLFYIIGDKVVVTQVTGEFESAWRATLEQLAHYRTGARIR